MATDNLTLLLIILGIPPSARYSIEETATILGLSPKAVRTQIKKGNLHAIRGSRRRWSGVFHSDLDAYLSSINPQGGA